MVLPKLISLPILPIPAHHIATEDVGGQTSSLMSLISARPKMWILSADFSKCCSSKVFYRRPKHKRQKGELSSDCQRPLQYILSAGCCRQASCTGESFNSRPIYMKANPNHSRSFGVMISKLKSHSRTFPTSADSVSIAYCHAGISWQRAYPSAYSASSCQGR